MKYEKLAIELTPVISQASDILKKYINEWLAELWVPVKRRKPQVGDEVMIFRQGYGGMGKPWEDYKICLSS